jgi:hypothetical protein
MMRRVTTLALLLAWIGLIAALGLSWDLPPRPMAVLHDTEQTIPGRFSPDGSWLLAQRQSNDVLLDLRTGKRIELNRHWHVSEPERRLCAFSPDGRHFAGMQDQHQWGHWSLADGAVRTMNAVPPASLSSVAYSHDGAKLAAVQAHKPLTIFDVTSAQRTDVISMDGLFGRPKLRADVSRRRISRAAPDLLGQRQSAAAVSHRKAGGKLWRGPSHLARLARRQALHRHRR